MWILIIELSLSEEVWLVERTSQLRGTEIFICISFVCLPGFLISDSPTNRVLGVRFRAFATFTSKVKRSKLAGAVLPFRLACYTRNRNMAYHRVKGDKCTGGDEPPSLKCLSSPTCLSVLLYLKYRFVCFPKAALEIVKGDGSPRPETTLVSRDSLYWTPTGVHSGIGMHPRALPINVVRVFEFCSETWTYTEESARYANGWSNILYYNSHSHRLSMAPDECYDNTSPMYHRTLHSKIWYVSHIQAPKLSIACDKYTNLGWLDWTKLTG